MNYNKKTIKKLIVFVRALLCFKNKHIKTDIILINFFIDYFLECLYYEIHNQ